MWATWVAESQPPEPQLVAGSCIWEHSWNLNSGTLLWDANIPSGTAIRTPNACPKEIPWELLPISSKIPLQTKTCTYVYQWIFTDLHTSQSIISVKCFYCSESWESFDTGMYMCYPWTSIAVSKCCTSALASCKNLQTAGQSGLKCPHHPTPGSCKTWNRCENYNLEKLPQNLFIHCTLSTSVIPCLTLYSGWIHNFLSTT